MKMLQLFLTLFLKVIDNHSLIRMNCYFHENHHIESFHPQKDHSSRNGINIQSCDILHYLNFSIFKKNCRFSMKIKMSFLILFSLLLRVEISRIYQCILQKLYALIFIIHWFYEKLKMILLLLKLVLYCHNFYGNRLL